MPPVKKNRALSEWVDALLLKNSVPPSVVTNEKGDIVHFHGRTGDYLEPPVGQPSYNILEMARPGLRSELNAAIRKAIAQDTEVARKGVQVKAAEGVLIVDVIAKRILDPEALKGLLLIQFIPAIVAEPKAPQGNTAFQGDLERELAHTKEHLQSTVEELEASNEELKSTNEELQSTNEELQSTNEELETAKEETQSLNEELQTVNSELHSKIEEVSKASEDLTNLLNSIELATIFLDKNLHLKRFTKQARKVISLIPSDVGRPIEEIVSRLENSTWIKHAREVLETLEPYQSEEQTIEGHWYLIRIRPYRNAEEVISGVVVTFADLNELKRLRGPK